MRLFLVVGSARVRGWLIAAVIAAAALTVVVYRHQIEARGLVWWGAVATVAVPCATFAWFLFRAIVAYLKRPSLPTPQELAAARDNLYSVLCGAWSEDVSDVYQNQPMRVRFVPWNETAQREENASDADGQLQGAGDFTTVAQAFAAEPRFRRVVLGDPGAGKSVLVGEFQRTLLEMPSPGDPLPVIVRAASWQAETQPLLDWLSGQMAKDYGWLSAEHARALLARGLVLPILDGFDEMPPGQRPYAIAKINSYHVYRPLIIASREEEYRLALGKSRTGVKGCAVVKVLPLEKQDARDYLKHASDGTWDELLDRLGEGDPLADALGNPLMLYLACIEYAAEGKDPEELLEFGRPELIGRFLLREFAPSVYAGEAGADRFRCTAGQAQGWLRHLSLHAYAPQGPSRKPDAAPLPILAWWAIESDVRRGTLGALLRRTLVAAVWAAVALWVLKRSGYWPHGPFSGPVNLTDLLLRGPLGRQTVPVWHTLATALTQHDESFRAGIFEAFVVLSLGVVGLSFASRLSGRKPYAGPVQVKVRLWRTLRDAISYCGAFPALELLAALALILIGLGVASTAAFLTSRSTWIALSAVALLGLAWVPSGFVAPSDISGELSPQESLARDREADMTVTVLRRSVFVMAAWLFCGPLVTVGYAIYAVTATSVTLVFGGSGRFESRTYTEAHLGLALLGRVPWRTMAFLRDASNRGLLRQVGAVYQYRHALLLDEWRKSEDHGKQPGRIEAWALGHGLQLLPSAREQAEKRGLARDVRALARQELARREPDTAELIEPLEFLAGWLVKRGAAKEPAATIEALNTYAALASHSPDVFLPDYAKALRRLRSALRWDQALHGTARVVARYRALAVADPVAHLPGYARTVDDYAAQLGELGRAGEALQLRNELLDVPRSLAAADQAALAPALAGAALDVAKAFAELPEAETAQPTVPGDAEARAIASLHELATTTAPAYLTGLALSQARLAELLWSRNQPDDAIAALRDALDASVMHAEHIAVLRSQLDQSRLTGWLDQLAAGKRRPGTRAEWGQAARAAAARCDERTRSASVDDAFDLHEAARGLAIGARAAGRRRAARLLEDAAKRAYHRFARPSGYPSDYPGLWLPEWTHEKARLLWKRGDPGAVTSTLRVRDLAAQPGVSRVVSTRANARIRRSRSNLDIDLARKRYEPPPEDLEDRADRLDTLAFERAAVRWFRGAVLAAQGAVAAQARAVQVYGQRPGDRREPAEQTLTRYQANLDFIQQMERRSQDCQVEVPGRRLSSGR